MMFIGGIFSKPARRSVVALKFWLAETGFIG